MSAGWDNNEMKWYRLDEVKPEVAQECYIYDVNDPENSQDGVLFYYDEDGYFYDQNIVKSTDWYSDSLPTHWHPKPILAPYPES